MALNLYDTAIQVDPDSLAPYECKIIWKGKSGAFVYLDRRGNDDILLKHCGQTHEEGLILWKNVVDDLSKAPIWRAATRAEYNLWVERTKNNVPQS